MYAYKPHYACFKCRKTFKRKLLVDINRDLAYKEPEKRKPSKCPECSALMANMGLDFESPKKNDIKAWTHVQDLYKSGITYHSCGCSGPGYIPKDKTQLIAFLNEKRDHYIAQQHFWANWITPQKGPENQSYFAKNNSYINNMPYSFITGTKHNKTVNKDRAIIYWVERVKEITTKINTL
jgi:hypothetical protein